MARLRTIAIRAGDVLLMQGTPDAIAEFAAHFGCVPLAERACACPDRRQALIAARHHGRLRRRCRVWPVPAAIAFAAGVLASMALRIVPPRTVYDAIDWPVVVLLGALIPVAGAMATTGAADLIANLLLENVAQGHADRRAGADPGRDHDAVGFHEQRRDRGGDVPDRASAPRARSASTPTPS